MATLNSIHDHGVYRRHICQSLLIAIANSSSASDVSRHAGVRIHRSVHAHQHVMISSELLDPQNLSRISSKNFVPSN
jgi:hypothetical protein